MTLRHQVIKHTDVSIRGGKPDVGHKSTIQDSINVCRKKINEIVKRMRVVGNALREADKIESALLDEYQTLNENLRREKIKESQLVYLRNML